MASIEIDLSKVVGKGYASFWNSKKRYRVLKGGRASKKSRTAGLWYIFNMHKHPLANTVVVRNTFNTNKDSTFAVLKWAARQLGVYHLWKFTESPLEARIIATGQKILFRGFDDPLKITSITVDVGVLCWSWVEEAFEIEDEEAFRTFDESIRGDMPEGLWKQITLSYNPWVNSHWTKTRFWDKVDPDADTFTTTYKCNEWLDDADRQLIEGLAKTHTERYKVVGLGEYGMPGGAYFDEFRTDIHVIDPFVIPDHWQKFRVFDYGLDMFAAYWYAIDSQGMVYFYREVYESNLIVSQAVDRMKKMTPSDESIRVTYAPPDLWNRKSDTGKSTFDIFREFGITLHQSSNSRVDGWMNVKEWLQPYETFHEQTGDPITTARVKIFKNCANLIRCLPMVQCDSKNPSDVSTQPHELTHAPDAFRYGLVMRMRPSKVESQIKIPKKHSKHEDRVQSFARLSRR